MNEQVRKVLDYYSGQDISGCHYKKTEVGTFVESRIEEIVMALQKLNLSIFSGTIKTPFLDAGSGNGRLVALAKALGLENSFGVEYDSQLVKESKQHLVNLFGSSAAESVVEGDFTKIQRIGNLSFSDFGVVYNYLNNEHKLVDRMNLQSKKGTVFLYNGSMNQEFEGFRRVGVVDEGESVVIYKKI